MRDGSEVLDREAILCGVPGSAVYRLTMGPKALSWIMTPTTIRAR